MSLEHLFDTITTGDALELSRAIPDESIDLVFCETVQPMLFSTKSIKQMSLEGEVLL
jgi:hypothetical protein